MNCISAVEKLRGELRSRWPEWATISAFAAVVAFAIPYHEPWTDEAQAWQIARSHSIRALFQTYIRYEATPGLWHFLLWILNHAHVSYAGMHWICGAIAVASTSLLVLKSPFPRYLKLTLPFTYFLIFQYAVVARGYVLGPLMLFLVALLWTRNSLWIVVLLGLLANLSLHAAVISGGLAIVYFFEEVRGTDAKSSNRQRQLLLCALILLCFYAFAIWTSWPPRDLLISTFRKPSRPFISFAVASLVGGICQPWLLSFPFWIAIALWLRSRRSLFYLLPVLFFAIFSGIVYVAFHHMGLLVPLVLCVLWITWPEPRCGFSWYEMIGRAALMFMVGTQILWSGYAITYDHLHAYSPGLATAQFLKPFVQEGATIAVTYLDHPDGQACDNIAILPYFGRNIFVNQQDSFWWWSDKNQTENNYLALLPSRPRIVVVEARPKPGEEINMQDPKVGILIKSGYRLTNKFCGSIPVRLELGLTTCNLIYQCADSAEEPSRNQVRPAS
jgi:hypothetical protein